MSEIKASEMLEILDKFEFFQGQRAGRELWNDKPKEVQDEDIQNFNRDVQAIREYLLAYEDAEEQGLLLRLPCKVGDELWTNCRMQGWYFRSNDAPYRVRVVFIGLNDSEEMGGGLFNVCYENRGYMMQFNFSDIGKTIFLTREEAEQALERGSE